MSCRVVADLLPLPATVENLQVTVGAASITLTWDQNPQSNQVTGYNVYRSTSPNTGFTLLGLVTVTSYTDSTGVAATLYYYRVAAVNSAGEGPYASISVTFPGDVTAPAVPTNLTLIQNGPTNVAADWDDNTEIDLAGYNIYASTAALGPFTKLNTTTLLPVSSYQHNAATPGNTWYYRVSAVDAALNESAFLTGNLAVVTPDVTAPAIPATPVASDIGSGISIDWVSNTEADLAGYNTYRSDDAFAAALNGITLLTASNYTDTTAVIGTPYSYKVDAKDTTGNTSSKSGASNTVTRTSPNTLDLTPYIKAGVMAPCPVHARGVSNGFLNPNYVSTGVVLINEGSDFPPLSNGSYEDARYDWNMAAGPNQPKGSRSTMRGFNTAHVYDQAGTYTITLKRTDSAGVVQNWACDVNVAADSRVKCYVSVNGDSSSLNSGTDITKPVSLTRAVALVAASGNIKVLLRRGDKFVTTGNVFSINKSNIWITSESTFAVAGQESVYPTITFSGVSGGRTFARVFANSLHCVVENLTFDQDYTDPSARSFDRIARVYGDANFVARNCNIIKCGHGVIMDDAGAARWILTQNLKALNDDSIAAYLVYGPCNDVVGLDLFSTNSILGHIVRHVNTCRALYAYCNCGQKTIIDPSSGQLEQLKTTFDFHHTLYVYVYKCTLPYPNASDGGQGQLQFGFANADTYNGTVCRYSVLELSVVGSQLFLPATCEHFVARNNSFNTAGTSLSIMGRATGLDKRGVQWTSRSSNIKIINNTWTNTKVGSGRFVRIDAGFDLFTYRNNVHIGPSLYTTGAGQAIQHVGSTTGTNYDISRNVWPSTVANTFVYAGLTYTVSKFNLLGLGDSNTSDTPTIDATFKPTFGVPSNLTLGHPVKGVWDSINTNGPGVVSRQQGASSWTPGCYQF